MKAKIGLILGFVMLVAVIITLAFYLLHAGAGGTFEYAELGSVVIIIILILSATYILWDRAKNIKKGLPAKDERLIVVNYKAGYYGFIAAIWSAVGANVLSDILFSYELPASQLAGVVVLCSGLVFMLSYLYQTRSGK